MRKYQLQTVALEIFYLIQQNVLHKHLGYNGLT